MVIARRSSIASQDCPTVRVEMSQRGKLHRESALSALHGDPFHFGHFFHREPTVLASAERNMRLIRNGAVIEMDHARLQSEGERSYRTY